MVQPGSTVTSKRVGLRCAVHREWRTRSTGRRIKWMRVDGKLLPSPHDDKLSSGRLLRVKYRSFSVSRWSTDRLLQRPVGRPQNVENLPGERTRRQPRRCSVVKEVKGGVDNSVCAVETDLPAALVVGRVMISVLQKTTLATHVGSIILDSIRRTQQSDYFLVCHSWSNASSPFIKLILLR